MTSVSRFIKKQIVSEQFIDTPYLFQVYTERQLEKIEALSQLSAQQRFEMTVVANVLPFRVNRYVIDKLIDWKRVPDDPIFQLVFPQKGMLSENDFKQMSTVLRNTSDRTVIQKTANEIRQRLNPHPAEQLSLNVPHAEGEVLGVCRIGQVSETYIENEFQFFTATSIFAASLSKTGYLPLFLV